MKINSDTRDQRMNHQVKNSSKSPEIPFLSNQSRFQSAEVNNQPIQYSNAM